MGEWGGRREKTGSACLVREIVGLHRYSVPLYCCTTVLLHCSYTVLLCNYCTVALLLYCCTTAACTVLL
jgi:hypothetical protein